MIMMIMIMMFWSVGTAVEMTPYLEDRLLVSGC